MYIYKAIYIYIKSTFDYKFSLITLLFDFLDCLHQIRLAVRIDALVLKYNLLENGQGQKPRWRIVQIQ